MKLRGRLLLRFGILLLVLFFVVGSTIWSAVRVSAVNDRLIELREPTVRVGSQLKDGLNTSLDDLRNWALLGNKDKRNNSFRIWLSEIDPALEQMKELSHDWTDPKNIDRLNIIERKLIKLKSLEKNVEELMLNSEPGEESGQIYDLHNYKIKPLVSDIRSNLDVMIDSQVNLMETDLLISRNQISWLNYILWLSVSAGILVCIVMAWSSTRLIIDQVGGEPSEIAAVTQQVALGNLDVELAKGSGIGGSVAIMLDSLRGSLEKRERQDWLKTGLNSFNEAMQDYQNYANIGQTIISEITRYLKLPYSIIYFTNNTEDQASLRFSGSIGINENEIAKTLSIAEGLIGQAARENRQILIEEVPRGYAQVSSGIGHANPLNLSITPIMHQDNLLGVIELGSFGIFKEIDLEYISQVIPIAGINIMAALDRTNLELELERTRALTSDLAESEQRTNAIVETAVDGILTINKKGIVESLNSSAEKMFGYSREEIIGNNISMLMPSPFREQHDGYLEAYNRTGVKKIIGLGREVIGKRKDGSEFPIYLSVGEMRGGSEVRFSGFIRDITEQKEAEKKIKYQNESMQIQQEELRVTNEELEEKAKLLSRSEEEMRTQQEELRVTNEELVSKQEILQKQAEELRRKGKERELIAEDLRNASRYKSEFLANMSHELRTPLNSLLLLSQSLASNSEGTLTEEQIVSANIIYQSGNDLLTLINDILDLSKIEAGKLTIDVSSVALSTMVKNTRRLFAHMIEEKGLDLTIDVEQGVPDTISTDRKRTEQIIRNFMSNAIKFTENGSITVAFSLPDSETKFQCDHLSLDNCVGISVRDTGIGIPTEKQRLIFEAFQQADGGTSRKYGGTGLGLSISRELAILLQGEIHIKSEVDVGTELIFYIPFNYDKNKQAYSDISMDPPEAVKNLRRDENDKRVDIDLLQENTNDKTILIIEDDRVFSECIREMCQSRGFKCLTTISGNEGVRLAGKYLPYAIILDINLPDIDGWKVLESIKENIHTRHIPVHIMSGEDELKDATRGGAIGYSQKPLSVEDLEEAFRKIEDVNPYRKQRVLLVEDDSNICRETIDLISSDQVTVDEANTGEEALKALRLEKYDCIILDLILPDINGEELLQMIEHEAIDIPPVIVYTAREISTAEEFKLHEYTGSIVIKDARSPERLLDEVSLFLHRAINTLPQRHRKMISDLHDIDAVLRNKKVLIVEDDMRTCFAMSKLLKDHGLIPLKAENGKRALSMLNDVSDIDLILMDIMMPIMDGYEAMVKIRENQKYKNIPIIALTAKAMPEDRGRCIKAGANDYMSKPIDPDQLISMLRVWLYK